MPTRQVTRHPKNVPLAPRVKVWLETGGRYAFGLGIAEILQAVGRAGSIKQAAADLGKSYRHVWGRVKAAEETLGRPLVETRVGGQGVQRSALTPEARRLVAAFLAFRTLMTAAAEQEFARCFG
jgi:molybdate transport system regulatory protein